MIQVVCAVIEQGGRLLITQHGPGHHHPLKWEFPGGKLKPGESPENAIIREIREELNLQVFPRSPLPPTRHCYPGRPEIELIPFWCEVVTGTPRAIEHHDLHWASPTELMDYSWCEADLPIVRYVVDHWKNLVPNS